MPFTLSPNNLKDIGYKFSLTKWEEQQMVYKLNADFARYDSTSGLWCWRITTSGLLMAIRKRCGTV